MKQLTSMIWKEWHETRVFLWIGMGIFLGLPCIAGVEALFQYAHRFEILAGPWVVMFGGVFALFVAVGATCRDLTGHLEDFWRSRPVGAMRWFLVKYTVGLTITLVVCALPLLVERWLKAEDAVPLVAVALMLFQWTTLYSAAFASGCLIRRPAHAAMLSLAVLLLIHFLPLALPPLHGLNAFALLDSYAPDRTEFNAGAVEFAAGMSVITLVMLTLSMAAVRYRWHLDAGQRLMYGAVSAALLIIFATAGYQLGTNLPILLQASIPGTETVSRILIDGNQGSVVTRQWIGHPNIAQGSWNILCRSLVLAPEEIKLGDPQKVLNSYHLNYWWPRRTKALMPGHPQQIYAVYISGISQFDCWLAILTLKPPQPFARSSDLKLWTEKLGESHLQPSIQIFGNRLYVIGDHLVILDISDPMSPRVLSDVPFSLPFFSPPDAGAFSVTLPRVPGLPPEQRLDAVINAWGFWYFPEEGVLCQQEWDRGMRITAWRLAKCTDDVASFQPIGEYRANVLEEIFGAASMCEMTMRDGLIYVTSFGSAYGNNRVTVFDVRDRRRLEPIGHFGAPNISTVCALPNGQALIGGSQLWLVGPPPGHK